VLGVPASPGVLGGALLALGLLAAIAGLALSRERLRILPPPSVAGALCLALCAGVVPYVVWRIVEDLRYTTRLTAYDASVAGPVQAYLQPYLLDGVPPLIPRSATYATAVSPDVPYKPARMAFPSLALQTLFPRRSVSDPRRADYVVTWGVQPAAVAPVARVWRVRARSGPYPAVYVGKVVG